MSKKIDLDSWLKELANKYQEPYNPADWHDCQARMRAQKVLNQLSFTAKLRAVAYATGIILLFNWISTDNQYFIEKMTPLTHRAVKIPRETIKQPPTPLPSEHKNIKLKNFQTELNETLFTTDKNNLETKKQQANNLIINNLDNYKDIQETWPSNKFNSNTPINIASINSVELQETSNPFLVNFKPELLKIEPNEEPLKEKEWQIGLIDKATELTVINRNSINLMLGMSAGLKGLEVSGIGNYEQQFVQGTQFAGIFNACMNDVKGSQVAGLLNYSGSKMQGVQIAGLANLAGMRPSSQNIIPQTKKFTAQIAALSNIDLQNPQDLQISAVANVANEVKGIQVSPGVNIAKQVKGIQWSMLLNIAEKVDGVQLGLLNVADSVTGVPIGFLSIVRKNGLQRLEVWTGETFQTNFGYKIGVEKFYNIFALSSQYSGTGFRWGLGYGIGTQLNLQNSSFINLDLIAYHINEKIRFTRELNLLSQFRVNFNHRFGQKVNFFAGPTLNTLFSDFRNSDNSIGSRVAPWVLYTDNAGTTKVKMWIGFNFGMSF